jgi:hypothetical protein
MTNRAEFHPLIAAAILTLAACGSGGASNNADSPDSVVTANDAAAPANESAAAAPAPAATATPAGFSADYMVGKWSAVNEDCSVRLEFRKDGTVTTPIGEAKYTVSGDKLSIDYHDGSTPTTSTVKALDGDRIEITHASGTKETEKRC